MKVNTASLSATGVFIREIYSVRPHTFPLHHPPGPGFALMNNTNLRCVWWISGKWWINDSLPFTSCSQEWLWMWGVPLQQDGPNSWDLQSGHGGLSHGNLTTCRGWKWNVGNFLIYSRWLGYLDYLATVCPSRSFQLRKWIIPSTNFSFLSLSLIQFSSSSSHSNTHL